MNQKAFQKISYGLYVITSSYDGIDAGCVANTLQQVTSSPAQLAITLNKDNFTAQIIDKAKRFCSVVLTQQCDMEAIKTFGFHCSKDYDKFSGGNIARGTDGMAYLDDHVAARFHCKVVKQLDVGTHIIFVGEVGEAEVVNEEEVMTYAYYHQVKNGVTPKNAPSYQKESEKQGWRCTICGYIYEGDVLPEGYICPICGAPADVFEKL